MHVGANRFKPPESYIAAIDIFIKTSRSVCCRWYRRAEMATTSALQRAALTLSSFIIHHLPTHPSAMPRHAAAASIMPTRGTANEHAAALAMTKPSLGEKYATRLALYTSSISPSQSGSQGVTPSPIRVSTRAGRTFQSHIRDIAGSPHHFQAHISALHAVVHALDPPRSQGREPARKSRKSQRLNQHQRIRRHSDAGLLEQRLLPKDSSVKVLDYLARPHEPTSWAPATTWDGPHTDSPLGDLHRSGKQPAQHDSHAVTETARKYLHGSSAAGVQARVHAAAAHRELAASNAQQHARVAAGAASLLWGGMFTQHAPQQPGPSSWQQPMPTREGPPQPLQPAAQEECDYSRVGAIHTGTAHLAAKPRELLAGEQPAVSIRLGGVDTLGLTSCAAAVVALSCSQASAALKQGVPGRTSGSVAHRQVLAAMCCLWRVPATIEGALALIRPGILSAAQAGTAHLLSVLATAGQGVARAPYNLVSAWANRSNAILRLLPVSVFQHPEAKPALSAPALRHLTPLTLGAALAQAQELLDGCQFEHLHDIDTVVLSSALRMLIHAAHHPCVGTEGVDGAAHCEDGMGAAAAAAAAGADAAAGAPLGQSSLLSAVPESPTTQGAAASTAST